MPLSGTVARKFKGKRIDAGSLPAQTGSTIRKFTGKRSEAGAFTQSGVVIRKTTLYRKPSGVLPRVGGGENKLLNSDLEAVTYYEPDWFQDVWDPIISGAGRVEADYTVVHGGFWSATLYREVGIGSAYLCQNLEVNPGERYVLSFWHFGNGVNSAELRAVNRTQGGWLDGFGDGDNQASPEQKWTYMETPILVIPSGCFEIDIDLALDPGGSSAIPPIYVDDIYMFPVVPKLFRKLKYYRNNVGVLPSQSGIVSRKTILSRMLSGTLSFAGSVVGGIAREITQFYESVVGAITLGEGVIARKFTGKRSIVGELVSLSEELMVNGDNEAAKASFSNDSTDSCTAVQSSDRSKSGTYSIKMTITGSNWLGWLMFRDDPPWDKVTPGILHKLSCSVYLPSGQLADTIIVQGLGGDVLDEVVVEATDSWVDVVVYVTPVGWFGFFIMLGDYSGAENNTSYCYVDNLSIISLSNPFLGTVVRKISLMRQLLGELTFSGIVTYSKRLRQFFVAIGGELPEATGTVTRYFTGTRVVTGISNFVGVVRRKVLYYRSDSGSFDFSGTVKGIIGSATQYMLYVWKRLT